MSVFSYLSGLFEHFKRNREKKLLYEVLTDSRAVFSSFGNSIYLSDFVNNCIDRIAVEVSKIEVVSVLQKDNSIDRLTDDISRLFRFQPNELQTTKDFLSCCEWLRRKCMNCFIYPQFEVITNKKGKKFKKYTAFYPLAPISAELGHFDDGRWAIKFYWRDGTNDTLPYDSVVHLRWRRGTSTLIGGGDDFGRADEQSAMRSLKILDELMQGLPKMVQTSLGLNGVLTVKTLADSTRLQMNRDEFEEHLMTSRTGIVATDLATDFTPIQQKFPEVPESTLKFVKDILHERYGISNAILSGDYNSEQHSAFYQNCIEDFIIEFEQAMSSKLFSQKEQDVGHRVRGYYSKVAYMDIKEKRNLAALGRDAGIMTINEIRDLYGMAPIPEGDRRLQSLNYVSTDLIDQYQMKQFSKPSNSKKQGAGKLSEETQEDENQLKVGDNDE